MAPIFELRLLLLTRNSWSETSEFCVPSMYFSLRMSFGTQILASRTQKKETCYFKNSEPCFIDFSTFQLESMAQLI